MDPNACLDRFCSALDEKDYEEARDAAGDLSSWMKSGGFEPNWANHAGSKESFIFWTQQMVHVKVG